MTLIARAVSKRKWEPDSALAPDEISADAVTADLRTFKNRLSFWRMPNAANDLGEAALAIASARDRFETLDLVWIEREALEQEGIAFEDTEGDTPIPALRGLHVEAVRLDGVRLISVARVVADAIRKHGQVYRFSKPEIMEMLAQAVTNRRLTVEALKEKVRRSLTLIKEER